MAVAAVDVIAQHDHAAVMILQTVALEEIDFLGLDAAVLGEQLQESGPRAIAGGSEDIIVLDQRGWNVGGAVGDRLVVPEQFAGGGIDADQSHFRARAA